MTKSTGTRTKTKRREKDIHRAVDQYQNPSQIDQVDHQGKEVDKANNHSTHLNPSKYRQKEENYQ